MASAGIPVVAHLGLTPQSVHQFGGYKVQGKEEQAAKRIMEDAKILEEAGAFSIVLECVPAALAKAVTQSLTIPTIGIGAGVDCDGQVLVLHDMVGMFDKFIPKFVKAYAHLNVQMKDAVSQYIEEVRTGVFPEKKHSF
jgi:3-methyl-2-oxobutanoate hydroxymethyltransferase